MQKDSFCNILAKTSFVFTNNTISAWNKPIFIIEISPRLKNGQWTLPLSVFLMSSVNCGHWKTMTFVFCVPQAALCESLLDLGHVCAKPGGDTWPFENQQILCEQVQEQFLYSNRWHEIRRECMWNYSTKTFKKLFEMHLMVLFWGFSYHWLVVSSETTPLYCFL